MGRKISIIIPVYNEEKTIAKLLNKVISVKLNKQIILVNDGSIDKTKEIIEKIITDKSNIKLFNHKKNLGKGSAIRTGLKYISGDIVIIQDADLEYNPNDYLKLIEPIINHESDVVFGSRRLNKNNKQHSSWFFFFGGELLTFLTRLLYGIKITDEATCYKVFKTDIIKSLDLKCKRFEFCPEVTAKLARKNILIKEVPILYHPRTKNDGKKINWLDGLEAVWTLIKYRFYRL